VVSQIAFSLLLLVAAGLFVHTLSNLESIELGFNRENVLLFTVDAKQAGYSGAALARFYGNLQSQLERTPGVHTVSLSNLATIGGMWMPARIAAPGTSSSQVTDSAIILSVGHSYFTTMQIPLLRGREIDQRDTVGARSVAVVSEAFAKKYFGEENPVGRHFRFVLPLQPKIPPTDLEVIGVSRNARDVSLKREDFGPTLYVPYTQDLRRIFSMTYEVRTKGDPLALANTVRQIVHQADQHIPVSGIKTQAAQIDQSISQEHIFAELCTGFALLALAIACVGLYGTMAYAVARRTNEIGIRMALGAQPGRIVWIVLREVLLLTVAGLAIGLPVAYATSHLVQSFLFGMKANDPVAISIAVSILLGSSLIAGYFPARRASRIDPMAALRHE
jgi:macrolide transport system ATP-binding/permease protein